MTSIICDPGWSERKLSNCGQWLSGGTPSKANPAYWGGSLPWASAKDMKSFRLYDTEDHLKVSGAEMATAIVPSGSILLLVRGMTLHNDIPICITMRDMAFNQDVKAIIPAPDVDVNFLAYWLLAQKSNLLGLVDSASHGTGRLLSDVLLNLEIKLPSLPEQRAIARILGSLDDKIEANRRMNQTLEEMARAIFKSWFVDYDPVRAKAEGRGPAGMDAETAALFPDGFEESEGRVVPKGWKVKNVGDVLVLAYGKALKEGNRNFGGIPVFGSNGQIGWHDEKLVEGPGIIVGRKGNPGFVTWSPTDFYSIDTTFYVILKDSCKSMHYVFHTLRLQDLASLGADSAVPGLNRNLAYLNQIVVPSSKILEIFDKNVEVLNAMIHANKEQSSNLSEISDAILPKLLSGEISIKEA